MRKVAFKGISWVLGAVVMAWAMPSGASASTLAFQKREGTAYSAIYRMQADGTNRENLRHAFPTYVHIPVWKPGGNQIAFRSETCSSSCTGWEIFVMNADGTNQTNLTNTPGIGDWGPSWSADGNQIAFWSERDDWNYEIYSMNADGTAPTRLTNDPGSDIEPRWSPDGSRIVFRAGPTRVGNEAAYEIYVMDADGSNRTRLTNNAWEDRDHSWSPEGNLIAFSSNTNGALNDIWVMGADGSNPQNLTGGMGHARFPTWKPDGTRIAFQLKKEDGSEQLFVMDPDGANKMKLADCRWELEDLGFFSPRHHSWNPAGTRIAFGCEFDPEVEGSEPGGIYVVNADGTNQTYVSDANDFGVDNFPRFAPSASAQLPSLRSVPLAALIAVILVLAGFRLGRNEGGPKTAWFR